MLRQPTILLLMLSALTWSIVNSHAAKAQSVYDLTELQPGQLLLNLSASESVAVAQDILQAQLEYSAQGTDRSSIQGDVNNAIKQALALLDESSSIKFSTLQYYVYAINPGPRQGLPTWRAQQSIRLESSDSETLLGLIGALQAAGLHVTNLSYKLSTQAMQDAEQQLRQAVLSKLQITAEETALQLGKSGASLIEISMEDNRGGAYPMMRAMAMEADMMQTPSAVPGETTVTLSITAKALLNP
jgi:predicted secreted protein